MSGPRFIPITILVDDSQATPKVVKLTNAFDHLDDTGTKASQGGFKNVFDSSVKAQTGLKGLGTESLFVKNQLSLLHTDAAKLAPALSNTASEVSNLTQGASGLGAAMGPTGLAIAAVVIIVQKAIEVAVTLGKHLIQMTIDAAKYAVEVDNIAKKTDFSSKTITGLAAAAGVAGVPVNSLSSSLIAFEKNIEAVREGDKGLGIAFKSLKIDITDNETALRSSFKTLAEMPQGYQRVVAAQRIFGGSGEEVLAIIDRTNGNLDEAMVKYHDLGALLSGEALRASRQFTDQQNLLAQQLEIVKTTIAVEFMPVILDMMTRVSDWLSTNREQFQTWGRAIEATIIGVVNNPAFQDLIRYLDLVGKFLGSPPAPANNTDTYQYDATAAGTDPESRRLQAIAKNQPKRNLDLGLGPRTTAHGSDPAAAAKRIAELQLKALLDTYKAEDAAIEREIKRSLEERKIDYADYEARIEFVEIKRHRAVLAGLTIEQKAASQLRDANARKVAAAQIDSRLTEENNRHLEAQLKLADRLKGTTRERIALATTLWEREKSGLLERPRVVGDYFTGVRQAETAAALRETHFDDESAASYRNLLTDIKNIEIDLRHVHAQNADDQFSEQRRLLLAKREEVDVTLQIARVQDEIATGPYNQALRLQLAYYEAIHNVQIQNETALVRSIQNQVQLAHQLDVDYDRLNDGVVDFLAHQKTLQETFQDVRTNTVRTFFEGIDKAVDSLTKHLGLAGSLLNQFLKDLLRLEASKYLQKFLGIGAQGQTAGSGGGGGSFGNLIGSVGSFFRPQGGYGSGNVTGPQSAQATALAAAIGGGGSGITAPVSLTSQLGQQNLVQTAIQQSQGVAGAAGSGGASAATGAGGLLSELAGPVLLGALLGSQLGGQSTTGRILGGIGGGGLAAAFLLGSLGIGAIAAPLLIAAVIFAKNAARRRDERSRDEAMVNSLAQLKEILNAVQHNRMDGSSAIASALQIREQYVTSVSALKDGKTRRIALADVSRLDGVIAQIKGAAADQAKHRAIEARIVPEFSVGGEFKALPYGRATAPLRSDYFLPAAARGLMSIPGVFDRKDDVLMRVSRGEHVAVMTPQQYEAIGGRDTFHAAGVPALATGGLFATNTINPQASGTAGIFNTSTPARPAYTPPALNFGRRPEPTGTSSLSLGRVKSENSGEGETITLNLRIKGVNADQVVYEGLQSSRNSRLVVKINKQADIDRE